jgi:mannosyltransferase
MLRAAVMVEYSIAPKLLHLHRISRKQTALICAALVTILAFALRFYQLGHEALWIDEALTDLFARRPLKAIWRSGIEADLTPPLWYTLQKAWMSFGDSEFVLRTPAALAGTLTIPVVIAIGRLVADNRAALFAGLLLATSVVHLHYSQEARSYALLALSASLAIWGLVYILEDPARALEAFRTKGAAAGAGTARLAWAAYAAGSILSLYSHNTAVFLVAWSNICWLTVWLRTGRSRSFFIWWAAVNLAVVASFAWWVPVIIEQSVITLPEGFGKSYTSWGAVADALKPVYGIRFAPLPTWFTALGATILATYGAWRIRGNLPAVIVLFGSILFVPLATALFSFWRPILVDRVLFWPVASLTLLVAVGVLGLPRRPAAIVATILIVLNCLGAARYYEKEVKPDWSRSRFCPRQYLAV